MKKKALKNLKDASYESDILAEDESTSNISDMKELDEYFEEARDRFPLEQMVKDTNYKVIQEMGSSDSNERMNSSSSSELVTPISTESELDIEDIQSVGTEKIYYELEGK